MKRLTKIITAILLVCLLTAGSVIGTSAALPRSASAMRERQLLDADVHRLIAPLYNIYDRFSEAIGYFIRWLFFVLQRIHIIL